jgi:hypothetical protein
LEWGGNVSIDGYFAAARYSVASTKQPEGRQADATFSRATP